MSNPPTFGFAGFGNPTSNNTNPSGGSGSSTAQQPSTGLFGATNPSTATATATPGNLFGVASSSTAPKPFTGFGFGTAGTSTAAPTAGGLFGGGSLTTPATATAAGLTNTANTSTAPTLNTGATSLFGAAASKPGGLFGSTPAPTGTAAPAATGGMFGTATPSATTAPTGGMFGGNLFGGVKPATAPPTTSTTPAPGALTSTAGQASTTTAAPPGGLFGLGAPKPADTSSSTPVPASTSLFAGFGKPPGTTPASATTPSTAMPNLFGGPAKDASKDTAAPTSTTSTTTAPGFGGFTLGAAPAGINRDSKDPAKDAAASSITGAATTAPAMPSLFGGVKPAGTAATSLTATPALGASASTTAAPAFGNLFGGNKDAKGDPTTAATTKPPALFGTPAATSTTAPGATGTGISATGASGATAPGATSSIAPAAVTTATTAAATSATTAPPLLPPSVLKGKTLEEIVDSWGTDLEKQAGEFKRIAGEVQEWDRVLMDNGNQVRNAERADALAVLTDYTFIAKIATLYALVLQAEKTQGDVEKSLDHIEEQQRQLSNTLDGYEKGTMDILDSQGMRTTDVGPADTERDKNYMLATSLNQQLDDLARNLSAMVDEVNSVTATSQHGHAAKMKPTDNTTSLATTTATGQGDVTMEDADAMDPMSQIQAILNAHLDSLSWINTSVRELEGKVVDLEGKFGGVLPPSEERQQRPARGGGMLQQHSTLLEGSGSTLGGSRYGTSSSFRR